MRIQISGEIRKFGTWARGGLLIASLLTCFAFVIPAQPALATFHLVSISEIYAGSAAQPESSYVELQMYEPGQNFVGNHSITLYDSAGSATGTFTFPANLPGTGANQQTMLVGDDGVEAAFGVKPDLVSSAFNLPAAGGAACWDSIDCVAWGDFAGATIPSSGAPADPPGIPNGMAIRRQISKGNCANLLDEADDTNDSDGDFADAVPSPQSYATVPSPPACAPPAPTPVVGIDSKPASPTSLTDAAFQFHASPTAESFQCRLDKGAYAPCDSGAASYAGPLADGIHTFRVRGSNANGLGTPTNYSWTVDTTAATASISSHPVNPSSGKSASFRYSSNESGSKFECRLKPLETAFTPCSIQPKLFSNLANGEYTFEVRAIDVAGNVQSGATPFAWTVDNSLEDTAAPDTAIGSKPPDPSSSPVASFTYNSSEPGSSFQCKFDSGNFTSCPASGIAYTGLQEGPHVFQVRAIDSSNNIDPSPAGYSFQVVLSGAPPVGAGGAGSPPAKPQLPAKPNTKIATAPRTTHNRTPTLRFSSNRAGAKFQCKLDGGPFAACRSPFTTKKLSDGSHLFQVRAVLGHAVDASPAKLTFKVVEK